MNLFIIYDRTFRRAACCFEAPNYTVASRIYQMDVQERCREMLHQPDDFALFYGTFDLEQDFTLVDVDAFLPAAKIDGEESDQ